jgi:hypothetical protein
MDALAVLAYLLDPSLLMHAQGMTPDPWQRDLLRGDDRYVLLNCSRQSGKSTTVATLALHRLLFFPGSLVLLAAPSERQSQELFRKVMAGFRALGQPLDAPLANQLQLELTNGSRLVALPGREDTIRSFSGVRLLVLDEASRVPDDVYRAVRPMLAVSQGRLIALSTPFGRRGWFYQEWSGSGPWRRLHVPWSMCPRITPEFIAQERRSLGDAWVEQEYEGRFTTVEGLVYPEFESAIVESAPAFEGCPCVGGIDFGWRNPFAAVWGHVDAQDVLWIVGERYGSRQTVLEHMPALPRDATWYADPAGAGDIALLRRHDFRVLPGRNDIRQGIAQIATRLRTGRLKVTRACHNLLHEARLYRYPTAAEQKLVGEHPVDAHNHALAALRYLVSRLDECPQAPR